MTSGSSNGWMNTRPVDAASASQRICASGIAVAVQLHLGAQVAHRAHLDGRRRLGHHDERRDAEVAGGVGHALRVIAGAGGDDAAAALRLVEVRHPVVGAAQLEAEDRLHVLALEQHRAAEPGRQARRRFERRLVGDVVDAAGQDRPQQIGRAIRGGLGRQAGHGGPHDSRNGGPVRVPGIVSGWSSRPRNTIPACRLPPLLPPNPAFRPPPRS